MSELDENADHDPNPGSFHSTIGNVKNSQVVVGKNNIVAGKKAAAAGAGGAAAADRSAAAAGQSAAAAGESAAGAGGSTAATERSPARAGLVERGKKSRVTKVFGVIAILATAAAIGLLVTGVTNLAVAGFVITAIALVVSIVPLFSSS